MTPQVELIWRDTDNSIHRKFLNWRRPCTDADLAEYIEDYLELLREGYRPTGYQSPPLPHCARVHHLGRVLAEWHSKSSPEQRKGSLVGVRLPPGRAGTSVAPPLTTCSEVGSNGRPSLPPIGVSDAIPHPPRAVNNASLPNHDSIQGQSVAAGRTGSSQGEKQDTSPIETGEDRDIQSPAD